jgi:hypothetical protein
METTNKINMLKSFEKSYDPIIEYRILRTDGTISVGKIIEFDKAQPAELFDDPETGVIWDSEEVPVNFFIIIEPNTIPEKINFRQIQDIRPFINS